MYEAYSDYESMMDMAEEIVTCCALAVHGKLSIDYQVKCDIIFYVLVEILCGIKIASLRIITTVAF